MTVTIATVMTAAIAALATAIIAFLAAFFTFLSKSAWLGLLLLALQCAEHFGI